MVGFSDATKSFSGTTVQLVGVGSTTVDANNQFCFNNVSAGTHRLEFSGAGHLTRRLEITVAAGAVNHFDDIDLVEPGPFDLAAFDEIYRSFTTPGTIRWNKRPKIMLDKKSLGDLPQGLDFFVDNVRQAYNTWLPNNTNGFFTGTPVTVGSIGPIDPDNFDCSDVPIGEIDIVGIDECPVEENFIILGTATHCFNSVGNEVLLGVIFFNPCTTDGTIDHEIIHTLCAGHLESRPGISIMGSPNSNGVITALDRRHMRYLYTRPAGTQTPDDAWGLTPLSPLTSAAGAWLGSAAGDLGAPVPGGSQGRRPAATTSGVPRPVVERPRGSGRSHP